MSKSNTWRRILAFSTALLLVAAGAAWGQAQAGNLYGTVTDNEGESLPGVTVELSGTGAPQIQITNAEGQFRFLGLSPSGYQLTASLEGFSTVEYPNIVISVNRNTTLQIELSPAVEETITVTSESPLLDQRKVTTGTTLNSVELEKVPSARDPWAILQTVPGVQTDRINVGGNESGQQSNYTGPGSTGDDAVWAVDGVVITDMAAIGSSPSYYNFDAFEEMQATTGGSDASLATSGVTLNMVTKRGTNEWRGSARFIRADEDWQSGLDISDSEFGTDFDGPGPATDQGSFKQGNRIVSVDDWGAEVGGPIVKDKLWIWANYGKNEIDLLTVQDFPDFTELEDYGAKLNAQLTTSNSLVAFYNFGDKVKIGRNASPTRTPLTTWNQTGPTDIYKLEDTHVFSSSFFLTGMASFVGGGFQLTPQGGLDGPSPRWDTNLVWQDNFIHHESDRPQDQAKIDGNYFFNAGDVSHDLKFGVGYRQVTLESLSIYPGGGVLLEGFQALGTAFPVFQASRNVGGDAEASYQSAYIQDTISFGNLTLNAGLRWDVQDGDVNSVELAGIPGFETLPDGTPLFPQASTPAFDQGFEWDDITPRVGLTYALGEERKTLLRASFARFAEQMSQGNTTFDSPGPLPQYAYFYYEDTNSDGFVTPNEVIGFENGPVFTNGFDPLAQDTPNQIDPGFEATLTDELILGIEHALRPEFVIGATVTARNIHNMSESERIVVENGVTRAHQRSDYVLQSETDVTRPDGSVFTVPFFGLRDGVVDNGGGFLTNGDREQDYLGLSLTFHKRLSNRWMLRGNLTLQDWEWNVPDSELEDPNIFLGGGNQDGNTVLQGSGTGSGSKGGVYITPGYSYSLTGMYQVAPDRPWGFNVSGALNGREGYAVPYFFALSGAFATAGTANLQATDRNDEFSLDDTNVIDLRIEKELGWSDYNFTVGVELFNALNESTVLQRRHQMLIGQANHVTEILSPRVFRVSLRFRFD